MNEILRYDFDTLNDRFQTCQNLSYTSFVPKKNAIIGFVLVKLTKVSKFTMKNIFHD